jgi:hypothetical protein
MNGDAFGSSDALASARDNEAAAVFDAGVFGLGPAKSGAENRAALQTTIDAACSSSGGGTVTIPSDVYEIAGEVIVAPPHSRTLTISGGGGRPRLIQTNGASSIFILGSGETDASGNIIMKDLSIEGSFSPLDDTDDEAPEAGSTLGTAERIQARFLP